MKLDTLRGTGVDDAANFHINTMWEHAYQKVRRTIMVQIKLQLLRYDIQRERTTLAGLTSHELEDIGIRHEDALRESQRSFTDIPCTRKSGS